MLPFDLRDVPRPTAEPEPHEEFSLLLNAEQARRIAKGELPDDVQEAVRAMVEWRLEDRRTWSPEERRGNPA